MKTFTTISIAAFLAPALAVPNVKVIPLGSTSCSRWPSWINTRDADLTGSLQFQVSDSEDSAINNLVAGSHTQQFTGAPLETLDINLRASRRFAQIYFRCFNGQISIGYGNTPAINIAKDQRNAHLVVGDGYKPEPYAHEIDGVRQPGVYLGVLNQTTWGFRYQEPEKCGDKDAYEVKLLNLPQDPNTEPRAAYDPEFQGFLKIVPF